MKFIQGASSCLCSSISGLAMRRVRTNAELVLFPPGYHAFRVINLFCTLEVLDWSQLRIVRPWHKD